MALLVESDAQSVQAWIGIGGNLGELDLRLDDLRLELHREVRIGLNRRERGIRRRRSGNGLRHADDLLGEIFGRFCIGK